MTEEIRFEKALEKLEKIVTDLESGDVSLEDALKKYEEGVRMSQACQKKLSQAEKKIEILTRTLDGTLQKEPFDIEEASKSSTQASRPTSKKVRKSSSKNEAVANDDLLI